MRRLLKIVGGLVSLLLLAAGTAALYIDRSGIPRYAPARLELTVDVTPERVERGRKSVEMLCAGCHLDNATGALSGRRMPDLPPQFGVAYSANITGDRESGIGSWTDGELAVLLRTGVTRDGRYLVQGRAGCFSCHSQDFAKVDDLVPERSAGHLGGGNAMPDPTGRVVTTSNITPDEETGIGKWSEDEFVRALRYGVRPDRSVIVYPMVPYPELGDDEARAIFAYLRTVPKIRNLVKRPLAPAVLTDDAGRAAYYRIRAIPATATPAPWSTTCARASRTTRLMPT